MRKWLFKEARQASLPWRKAALGAIIERQRRATPIISAHPSNRIVFVQPLPKS